MENLKNFIKKNNLTFADGRRNQDMLTLVGYALHKECDKEIIISALKPEFKKSSRTKEEFERVYPYAKTNNYGKWWDNIEVVDGLIIK